MISLTMSREDWRTGSIPELPLLRMQKFKAKKGLLLKKLKKKKVYVDWRDLPIWLVVVMCLI
ncbi:hypothetical protein, partial [Lactococcus lactis]|uniref:hypothetical protein n=1 Tax=Lactococcus lactis TaxID=1358 RepID=UPI00288099BB